MWLLRRHGRSSNVRLNKALNFVPAAENAASTGTGYALLRLPISATFCAQDMKKNILLLTLFVSSVAQAIEVCVAPIPAATTGRLSLSNPTARETPYAFTIKVGTRTYHQEGSSSQCGSHEGTDPIAVKVLDSGTPKESFKIDPHAYPNGACIWFEPLYSTWSVWPLGKSNHLCHNRTEQDKQADA